MNTSGYPRTFSAHDLKSILPHRGLAMLVDSVQIDSAVRAIGRFAIKEDDPRITGHFGIMPGVLMAESCHLTGAALLLSQLNSSETIPVLSQSEIHVHEAAYAGDTLLCYVQLLSQHGRGFHFQANLSKLEPDGKECSIRSIGHVLFSGTNLPHRVFNRMRPRRSAESSTPSETAAMVLTAREQLNLMREQSVVLTQGTPSPEPQGLLPLAERVGFALGTGMHTSY